MSVVSGIVVFVILWWTVLFAVLPWKARPVAEPVVGHATSAPEHPRLAWKAMWTTIITAVLWLIVYAVVASDMVSFRRWVAPLG
ncbi:MAG: DUF1467 family protein [Alphaproteobacteria bacterium]|nr:DUF1467 family protein [Alphaproteobacteria bacterium]TAD87722.1 MAG: DUF1467 family protein [Alphaproteobacteria bacterium]